MSSMQQFYESEIAVDQATPYTLLTQAIPDDILAGELLEWYSW